MSSWYEVLDHFCLNGPPITSLKANDDQPWETFFWEIKVMCPSNNCFHDQIPVQLFQVLPITLTKENKSLLTQFWQSSIRLFMLFQLFLVEKINMVSKKKKNHTQSKKHYPGPSKAQPWFSAWFNESFICQQPISLRCDSDCPKASDSLPNYPSMRAQLRNVLPRTKPVITRKRLVGRRRKVMISIPALDLET